MLKTTIRSIMMKKKISIFFIIISLLSSISYGGTCDSPVNFIEQNVPAYCSGFLYTREYDAIIRATIEENKYNLRLVDLQNKKIDIMETRIKLYMENESLYQEQLLVKEQQGFWSKTLYFLSGALITGAIAVSLSNSMR